MEIEYDNEYIKNLRKPETLEEKYKVAVNALQAIAQRDVGRDELDVAIACYDISSVAIQTLRRLGEKTEMKNKNSYHSKE
jgi:20S proteasome alpha/beta subunit